MHTPVRIQWFLCLVVFTHGMKPTKLEVKLTKTSEGMLAQCLDRPEIIVGGKNRKEVSANLEKIISGYVEAFPETKGEFFDSDNKMYGVNFV